LIKKNIVIMTSISHNYDLISHNYMDLIITRCGSHNYGNYLCDPSDSVIWHCDCVSLHDLFLFAISKYYLPQYLDIITNCDRPEAFLMYDVILNASCAALAAGFSFGPSNVQFPIDMYIWYIYIYIYIYIYHIY